MKNYCFLLILLCFLGCNQEPDKKYMIGVSQCSDDLWRSVANKEMQRESSFYSDLSVEIRSANDNTQKQIEDIEYFIQNKADLIVVSPNEAYGLVPVIERTMSSNIPVVLLDRKLDTDNYTAYVGADNYDMAHRLGIYLAGKIHGKGNVVVIRGLQNSTADTERYQGFADALKNYPNIHIVAEKFGDFFRDEAKEQMDSVIATDISIDAVFAMNDQMALGVSDALPFYRGSKRPFIIGIDALYGEGGGIELIEKGIIDASSIYPTGGEKVIQVAHHILTNQPYHKINILNTDIVDKNNLSVLQIRDQQLEEQYKKFDHVNNLLNRSLDQYANQRFLLYLSLFVLFLLIVVLILSYYAYRTKNRANRLLTQQNEEIRRQAVELETQKNQLLELSTQLEEATNAKLVFFTNISHEFKTPLSLILGPVETLLKSNNLSVSERDLLSLIQRNSKKLMQLISEIIEFRSFENGKMKMHYSKCDIKIFLKELTDLFVEYKDQKKVSLDFIQETPDIEWLIDMDKIEKVYFNILFNAFKYVNVGGNITIKISTQTIDGVPFNAISIFNTGSYISTKDRLNIFDRFYTLSNTNDGTGVGLALTSSLVAAHQGKIDVESEKEKGTTFTVLLPVDIQNEDVSIMPIVDFAHTYSKNKLNLGDDPIEKQYIDFASPDNKNIILVIEDNKEVRDYIHHLLQDSYRLIEAKDGEEGVQLAIKHIPDLIISDVMMPNKDGYETSRELRKNASTSHIPIIFLTACGLDEQKAEGFESGADAYIPKPFNPDLLKIRIRKLIENREKTRQLFSKTLVDNSHKVTLADSENIFLTQFKTYVEDHISDTEMSVDDIAKSMSMSRVQLYRKLKSLTSYSPNEMIRIIRLQYAKQLLVPRGISISEVAYQSGFSSPSYFTKCFKDFFNESPTDFLK